MSLSHEDTAHHHLHHEHHDEHLAEHHHHHHTANLVADPLASLHYAQDVVDATVGGVLGEDEDEAALRAGEEAATAAMEAAASAEEAAALAEEAVGAVLMDPHDDDHEGIEGDDEIALAAAAAAAAVTEGMSLVVDQALLATAAAAAASQISHAYDEDPHEHEYSHHHHPHYAYHHHAHDPTQLHLEHVSDDSLLDHDSLLEQRRIKDRKRYAGMSDSQRAAYNAHRRELYHKQGDAARKRRRERERNRYHSLEGDAKKERNARRAKLERDRYNKLTKEELELRNAKRRERAATKKVHCTRQQGVEVDNTVGLHHYQNADGTHQMHIPHMHGSQGDISYHHHAEALEEQHHEHHHTEEHGYIEHIHPEENHHPEEHGHVDHMNQEHDEQHVHEQLGVVTDDVIADAVSAAAEVAEQAIGAMMDDNAEVVAAAMGAVHCETGDASTVEI